MAKKLKYEAEQIASNAYHVTMKHNGEEITFDCVVAEDKHDELPDLVAFHIDQLDKPPPTY